MQQATERSALLASGCDSEIPLDEVMQKIGTGWFHIRLLVVCGLGFAAAAIEVVVTAFLFVELRADWHLSEYELAGIPSIVGVGTVLGSVFWGLVADFFGRKATFMATSLVVAVFGILSASSTGLVSLTFFRFLVASGFGGNIAVDFSLFAEFLPTRRRATMLFCMHAFWPLGQLATCLIAWSVIPQYGWRAFLAACAVPSIVTAAFRPFILESPHWLVLHGYREEATEVCRQMAIGNGKQPDEVGLTEGRQVSIRKPTKKQDSTWAWSHFTKAIDHPLFSTAVGVVIVQVSLHVAGYAQSTIMPTLLEAKGIKKRDMYFTMVVSAISQLPGIFLAGLIATNYGRLPPMKSFLFLVAICLLGFSFANSEGMIITLSCFGSMFVEAGWALTHTYVPEVFPTELRTSAMGFLQAVTSVVSWGLPTCFAYVITNHSTSTTTILTAVVCAFGGIGAATIFHIETYARELTDRVEWAPKPYDSF